MIGAYQSLKWSVGGWSAVKRTQNFHDHLHTPHPLEEGDNQAKWAKNDSDPNYFLKLGQSRPTAGKA